MNNISDSNTLAERDEDAANTAWARIEAAYRDTAVAIVASKFNALVPQDFGEPLAYLTDDENVGFQLALRTGDIINTGRLYMNGLDRMREQYMCTSAAELEIQAQIMKLVEENEE